MTHFYLTLPSNSSQQYFPDNTLTEFTTKLPSTIELANEWEVGLAEIMFPRRRNTISKDGMTIVVDYRNCDLRWKHDTMTAIQKDDDLSDVVVDSEVEIKLNGGFHKSMEELTSELNLASMGAFAALGLEGKIDHPTFYYKAITRRMYVFISPGMSVKFPPSLESILGLTPPQNPMCNNTQIKTAFMGEHSCDLQAGIHALYIYCDLLQFTHVGNIKAPLLRVVDIGDETGDVVTRYYERPRYIPLQKKNFDSIQILIRDDLGDKIQFENGKLLLTLHFRRAYNKYLI